MTFDVVTVEPSASLVDAAKRMITEKKGPLPVVEAGKVVGMLTDRDIIARVVAEGRNPTELSVKDVASKHPAFVNTKADLDEVRQTMDRFNLDRLLVIENERLIGIISEADLRTDEGPLT
jgi:CBS domain-containing protein